MSAVEMGDALQALTAHMGDREFLTFHRGYGRWRLTLGQPGIPTIALENADLGTLLRRAVENLPEPK
jgi:hypothetical protein